MTYQVLKLREFFTQHYKLHAASEMEFSFEPFGEDDQAKRKSSLAFVKKMTQLQAHLEDMYVVQKNLLKATDEFAVVFKLGSNEVAFYALAPLYAKLEKALKEFFKTLKKYQNLPDVAEYFKKAEVYSNVNVFDMMKEDFSEFEKVTTVRMEADKKRFPDFKHWDSATPDWDVVKEKYKSK